MGVAANTLLDCILRDMQMFAAARSRSRGTTSSRKPPRG